MPSELNFAKLLERVHAQETELKALQAELAQLKSANAPSLEKQDEAPENSNIASDVTLRREEYKRYGRQMILPEMGMSTQLKLRKATVVIVGLGGLGCPAAAYLAGAGVGTLGLVDGDVVEISNLHRQILHTTQRVGQYKVDSAAEYIHSLNPNVRCKLYRAHLDSSSALDIFADYDLVLDCTDRPSSRYLISDAAVCSGVPLVSAAAVRTDGQLFVLNCPPFSPNSKYESGPCYRCLNPKPPAPESVLSCGESGILGPVVGTMGILMATEAIKIISSPLFPYGQEACSARESAQINSQAANTNMLIYTAYSTTPFRSIRLKGRRADCVTCSPSAERRLINSETLKNNSVDYVSFCGLPNPQALLEPSERLEPERLRTWTQSTMEDGQVAPSPIVLDVRDATQFGICKLPQSINVPLAQLEAADFALKDVDLGEVDQPLVVVCRYGNDSQVAVKGIREHGRIPSKRQLFDLRGGLQEWRTQADPEFPNY